MTSDLLLEKKEDYLCLKFDENTKIDIIVFKEAMEQVHLDLSKHRCSKVLLDLFDFNLDRFTVRKRIVAAMILFDVFKYIQNIKIAVYMDNNDYDGTVKKYAEMKGFNIEMFSDEDEAIEWLRKEEK